MPCRPSSGDSRARTQLLRCTTRGADPVNVHKGNAVIWWGVCHEPALGHAGSLKCSNERPSFTVGHKSAQAHPGVHARMLRGGWDKRPGVRIIFGRWCDPPQHAQRSSVPFSEGLALIQSTHDHHACARYMHCFCMQLPKQRRAIWSNSCAAAQAGGSWAAGPGV